MRKPKNTELIHSWILVVWNNMLQYLYTTLYELTNQMVII
jgi:hypothetical protein